MKSIAACLLFLAALITLLQDAGRGRNLAGAKIAVGVVGAFFGFFLAAYPGVLLSATARPLWAGGHALGALFLAVGASTGAAAIALVLLLVDRRAADGVFPLRTMLVLALVIQLVAVVVFVLSVQGSASVASAVLTSGAYSLTFWLGAVVVGSVLPLLIGLVDFKRRSPGLTALASVLVLVGGFLVKYVIVAAGQA